MQPRLRQLPAFKRVTRAFEVHLCTLASMMCLNKFKNGPQGA